LSHSLQPHFPYPDPSQREDFYRAYLSVEVDARNGEEVMRKRKDVPTDKVDALEREVRVWSPACSVFWALWGIVQGEAQVRGIVEKSLTSVICH
jgi:choline kinase